MGLSCAALQTTSLKENQSNWLSCLSLFNKDQFHKLTATQLSVFLKKRRKGLDKDLSEVLEREGETSLLPLPSLLMAWMQQRRAHTG